MHCTRGESSAVTSMKPSMCSGCLSVGCCRGIRLPAQCRVHMLPINFNLLQRCVWFLELCNASRCMQLGAFLVQELETGPLEDDRLYLEHLLCSWSTYHPEAAKRLCINLVAADVLFNSIDPDVQVFANWNLLSQQEEALSLVSRCASTTLLAVTDMQSLTCSSY